MFSAALNLLIQILHLRKKGANWSSRVNGLLENSSSLSFRGAKGGPELAREESRVSLRSLDWRNIVILRSAQDDKRSARNDSGRIVFSNLLRVPGIAPRQKILIACINIIDWTEALRWDK